MTIESIIFIFSLALLSILVLFLFTGLIYSRVNKIKQKKNSTISISPKVYTNISSTSVNFNEIPAQTKLNYITINPNHRKTNHRTKQIKINSNTHSTYSSLYQVFHSSKNPNSSGKNNLN